MISVANRLHVEDQQDGHRDESDHPDHESSIIPRPPRKHEYSTNK